MLVAGQGPAGCTCLRQACKLCRGHLVIAVRHNAQMCVPAPKHQISTLCLTGGTLSCVSGQSAAAGCCCINAWPSCLLETASACVPCQPEVLPPPVGRRFLNRILGLPLARQNLLFNYFFLTLTSQIQTAKAEGKYSEGVSDLSGGKLVEVKEPQVGSEHPAHTRWGNSIVHLLP